MSAILKVIPKYKRTVIYLELSFHGALSHIKHYYKLETNVAVSKNKLDKHNILWSGLGEYLKEL